MKIHIVKKGESLYQIAQKYHIELDKLIAANPQIADPNVVDVGTKVKIPHEPKPVTPPTDYLYKHTVVQGDSLWKLGKAWGVPLAEMVAANPQLKNPNVLMTGDIVYIPKLKPAGNPNPATPPKADTSQVLPLEAAPISELPEAPVPTNVAPAMEAPMFPNIPNIHNIPNMEFPYTPATSAPVEGVQHYEPADNMVPPNLYPMWGMNEQPAEHPFQQFQMPAVQAMAHEQLSGKGKENAWAEPELPGMPVMPTMTSPEMPYYEPHAAYPLYTPQPLTGGDCGCGGKPEHPYSAHQPVVQPWMVQPNEPFLAMPQSHFPHHMPIMPYAEPALVSPYQTAGAGGYPATPAFPGHGSAAFGVQLPWEENENVGGKEKSAGKDKSRGEQAEATITQVNSKAAAKKAPKRKSKQSSARAAISSLIERNRRAARNSSRTHKASPWLSR